MTSARREHATGGRKHLSRGNITNKETSMRTRILLLANCLTMLAGVA